VLGPSLGTDTGLFDPQAVEFARSYRVVRYDLRGHGGSEVVPGACTMADLAGDVLPCSTGWGSTASPTPVSPSAGRSACTWR
jgi:3-oxoadipate enol-lactonase